MQKKRILPLLILLNTFISGGVFAATAVCDSYLGRPTNVNQTPRLGATTISIGADTPIGTVLHQVNFTRNAAASPWISCRPSSDGSTYNIAQYLALSAPPALVPGWTGQYAGALYQSGVSGIGFAIVNRDGTTSGQAVTPTPTLKWQTPIAATIFNFYYGNALSLVLVKTGPISTGTISAATLPTVRLTAAGTIPVTGLDTTPWTIQFSGDIQVINSTCNVTSSPNVPMGKYAIENYFGSGKPNNTPWVPFSITLSGCAIFNGNYTGSTNAGVFDGDVTYGVRQTNYLQTTFAPVNGVIDDAKGIMRLQSVANSATGVGIQLAQDTGAVDPVLFSFSAGFRQNVNTSMPGNITIPMKARYIQAGSDPLKPGLANSSTVFTINYR